MLTCLLHYPHRDLSRPQLVARCINADGLKDVCPRRHLPQDFRSLSQHLTVDQQFDLSQQYPICRTDADPDFLLFRRNVGHQPKDAALQAIDELKQLIKEEFESLRDELRQLRR